MVAVGDQRKRQVVLALSVLLVAILLVAIAHSNAWRAARFEEDARGCDWFGYLRQARLFQEKGWIGGLDTSIRDDQTRYLIGLAKSLEPDPAAWAHAISPHCHHYVARVDRVILQYPPGTGFLHSFFAEGIQARSAFILMHLLMLAVLLIVLCRARSVVVPWLVAGLGVFCFLGTYRYVHDRSIPPSVVSSIIVGGLTVAMCTASTDRRRIVLAAILALTVGISASFRLINALQAVGPAIILGVSVCRARSKATVAAMVAFVAGMALGLLPVLAANAINAGHPLATTYSFGDASLPNLTPDKLIEGFKAYFVEWQSDGFYAIVAAIALIAVWALFRNRAQALLIGAVNLIVGVGYIISHEPRAHYYLFPFAVVSMSTAVFGAISSLDTSMKRRSIVPIPLVMQLALVAIAVGTSVMLGHNVAMPISPNFRKPDVSVAFRPGAIIWGDSSTGDVSYFLERQAAVLSFMDPDLQVRFVAAIQRDQIPQYVVVDSDPMTRTAERLRRQYALRPVGQTFGWETFLVEPVASKR